MNEYQTKAEDLKNKIEGINAELDFKYRVYVDSDITNIPYYKRYVASRLPELESLEIEAEILKENANIDLNIPSYVKKWREEINPDHCR